MNKHELLKLLKENLRIKIHREKVQGNYNWETGEKRLKVVIEFNGEVIDWDYIEKEDLEFIK